MDVCNYCRRPADLLCVRCRDRYCSKKCQDQDWAQHKLFCFPMPSLMRPPVETTFVKSEPVEPLRPPSPSSKCRNIKMVADNDITPKGGQQSLLGSATNIPKPDDSGKPIETLATNGQSKSGQQPSPEKVENIPKSNDSVKSNGISVNNVPSVRPTYYKTDVATIRKPGTLSQVMPNKVQPSPTQPAKQAIQEPKPDKVEPPKQQKVELPKQEKVEPPKQPKVEPTKQPKVEAPKQPNVEPPKQPKVEAPKQPTVEAPKQPTVEPPKQQKVEPAKTAEPAPVQSPNSGPWMKPFPMEDNVFNDITIQYVAPDGTAWVSLVKKEGENTNLLRKVNKIVSVAATPDPKDIQVNSLFIVPYEDIYYRGVVLKPATREGTVSLRLVDFGNEFDLPIGELKTALPSVCEENAFAFPIKFKNPRNAEIGICLKVKKESIEHGIITVSVEGEVDAPSDMITMNDIDVVPLPEGANKDVFCLDFSNVGSGYVSLCAQSDKAVKFIESMGVKMSKYCEEMKDEYRPQVNELCLAKFEDEGWFRALTLKVIEPNKFEIMFIDYGNISKVTSSAIRKMTSDFTHPCLMNVCYIKDFPKAPTKDDITKAAIYFDANPALCADLIEKNGDKYFVSCKF